MAQHAFFLSSQAVLDSFLQLTVLTEQLNQLHVHMWISWPCCQFSLEEVKQTVPTLLPLTTQQTLLQSGIDKPRVSMASFPLLANIHTS